MSRVHLAGVALAATAAVAWMAPACSAELGPMPAQCPDGACPEGYECIQGVCAEPGTRIPSTLARLSSLRPTDVTVVPQSRGVLVVWMTYAYDETFGQTVRGVRLSPAGEVSEELVIVDDFSVDQNGVEPYFDALALRDDTLLVALAAGPDVDDDDPRTRLVVYRGLLPSVGSEAAGSQSAPSWDAVQRLSTIGYGAVAEPRFLRREDGSLALGTFETRALSVGETGAGGGGAGVGGAGVGGAGVGGGGGGAAQPGVTFGDLAVFELEESGDLLEPVEACAPSEPACCGAHRCVRARDGLPVSVGLAAAMSAGGRDHWVLDVTRPSALRFAPDDPASAEEVVLPPLAMALAVEGDDLTVLVPSERTGIATDLASGPARLERGGSVLGELPTVRDTPRPAWVPRDGARGVIVTPGADLTAPELLVYLVDLGTGAATEHARIPRLSTVDLGAIRAQIVGGKLFVVWLESPEEDAVLRAAVLDEPPP